MSFPAVIFLGFGAGHFIAFFTSPETDPVYEVGLGLGLLVLGMISAGIDLYFAGKKSRK